MEPMEKVGEARVLDTEAEARALVGHYRLVGYLSVRVWRRGDGRWCVSATDPR